MDPSTTTQTTLLTNNVIAQCTFLNDANFTCRILISYQGKVLWATQTTSTNTQQQLSDSVTSGNVGLKAGCTLSERISGKSLWIGGSIIVTFDGEIVDGGSVEKITGTEIGIFI